VLLLLVRCGILVLAAAALARPLILTRERKQSLDRGLARAIVVDTSASMKRLTPQGRTALDSAIRVARAMAAGATTSIVVESAEARRVISGANEWLIKQGRRGELVVVSDFQRGTIDAADLAIVRKEFGIALHRVPVVTSPVESRATWRDIDIVARGTTSGDRTDAEWTPAAASPSTDAVILLGAESDRALIRATLEAAKAVAIPLPVDTARAIAVVFGRYPDEARLKSVATAQYAGWMVDQLTTLRRETPPVVSSGVADVNGRSRLVLFTEVEPGSLAAARLAAASRHAMSVATRADELEPDVMSDAALTAMQRPSSGDIPSQSRPVGDNGPSDGRWVWLAVLVLLIIETVLRRGDTNETRSASVVAVEELRRVG
jgi:hypothetical protein